MEYAAVPSKTWELSLYELHRTPQEAITDGTEIAVSPRSLHSELMCPICLDMLKNTMTTKECLHRSYLWVMSKSVSRNTAPSTSANSMKLHPGALFTNPNSIHKVICGSSPEAHLARTQEWPNPNPKPNSKPNTNPNPNPNHHPNPKNHSCEVRLWTRPVMCDI